MTIRERNGSWQVDVSVNKVRHRHTFDTKDEALEWEADVKHAAKLGRPLPKPNENVQAPSSNYKVTMQDVLEFTIQDSWGAAKSSSKLILNGQLFLRWFGADRDPKEVTHSVLADYKIHLRDTLKNANATVNRKLSAARLMLKVARDRGYIENVPSVKRMKEPKGVINFLHRGEEDPILTHLTHRGLTSLADLVIILIDTGVRLNEALGMQYSHINWTGQGTITFPNRKSGNISAIPMTKRVRIALERCRLHGKDADKPFGDVSQRWARDNIKEIYACLGGRYSEIEQPFHVFRHSCASRLAAKGVSAVIIMEWMDHSSLLVTQRYMHLAPDHLGSAINALEEDASTNLSVIES